ncbi:hypothetical protein OAJ43_04455 [Nitrosomonadales bacterium]|nr:hypothetical protein [Nitrosomonadales bacterium]
MKKLTLLFLMIPMLGQSKEIFINEQGIRIEYSKPSVSCIYDKEAYEGYLNTCLIVPNKEICAQTKYEMYICGDKNEIKKLEEKSKN